MSDDLHVVDATMFWSPTGGGVRRYLLTKQAFLASRPGWRHTLAVPLAPDAAQRGAPGVANLPSWPLPGTGGYRLPLRRRSMADTLAELRPDLVEAGDPYVVSWAAADAAQRLHIPALAYCHSNLEMMARLAVGPRLAAAAGRAARAYGRRVYGRFDQVLAPSESMRRQLVDWGVTHAAVQPLGVDTGAFTSEHASVDWRGRLGLPSGSRVLVYAGRFAAEKHLDVLAAAVDRLGAPYTLLAIGAGPRPPTGGRVRVLPFLPNTIDLATALASADAFVHAGDQETFGLSVLEAMACGLPVIARRAAGLAELVDDSVGMGVDAGEPAAFAEAIAAVFASDRAPRQRAARQRAEDHDWAQVLPSLLDRYRRLIGKTNAAGIDDSPGPRTRAAPGIAVDDIRP